MEKKSNKKRINGVLGRIGVGSVESRKLGYYIENGNKYVRQEVLPGSGALLKGRNCKVSFSMDIQKVGFYAIIPAEMLQPSHLGNIENPLYFIPEAQPRNRSTSQSGGITPRLIAERLRPEEITEGSTAYSGAPIVNTRGEVIQGNGRAYTMKYYWENFPDDPSKYYDYLRYSGMSYQLPKFSRKEIRNPVLVRMLTVSDEEAIKLGQYKQSDLEAVVTRSNEIKSTVAKIDDEKLARILENTFEQNKNEDLTLNQLVRKSNLLTQLIRQGVIKSDVVEDYMNQRTQELNPRGVAFVSEVVINLIFRNTDTNTPELYQQLPHNAQVGIAKSAVYLLRCQGEKSISKEVSAGILAASEFLNQYPKPDIKAYRAWLLQTDMFGNNPELKYDRLSLKMCQILTLSTSQGEMVEYFQKYSEVVNDRPADMFNSDRKGLTKAQGVKLIFGIDMVDTTKNNALALKVAIAKAKIAIALAVK